jgi:hypothetical protein
MAAASRFDADLELDNVLAMLLEHVQMFAEVSPPSADFHPGLGDRPVRLVLWAKDRNPMTFALLGRVLALTRGG